MLGLSQVLRLDPETLFWEQVPGESQFDDEKTAIRAAQVYYETTDQPCRAVNQKSKILWDSTRDLPRKAVEPAELPFNEFDRT